MTDVAYLHVNQHSRCFIVDPIPHRGKRVWDMALSPRNLICRCKSSHDISNGYRQRAIAKVTLPTFLHSQFQFLLRLQLISLLTPQVHSLLKLKF